MSSSSDPSDQQLLSRLREGDEAAARAVFERYTARLVALARMQWHRRLSRRLDPEDIVYSAWRSFLIGGRHGRWSVVEDDLWPLLAALTLRKLARQVERHTAQRRDVVREQPWDDFTANDGRLVSVDPPEEHALVLADELEDLLEHREPLDREIVYLRLSGEDPGSVASELGCSERSVRRVMEEFRGDVSRRQAMNSKILIGSVNLEDVLRRMTNAASCQEGASDDAQFGSPEYAWFSFADLRLHKLVGQGGIGRVYRATLRAQGLTVAVKFLKKSYWRDAQAVRSLMTELESASRISHPGVLRLQGHGKTPSGVPFVVMDWFDGVTLRDWVLQSHPSLSQLLKRVAMAARALDAAHAAGVIHGDVTPLNVMTSLDGRVVVTDFGFANLEAGSRSQATGGTRGFLAPEQLSSASGPIGPWTDVYGLGQTLLVLMRRDTPSASTGPGGRHEHSEPWTNALEGLLRRCTATDASLRPQSLRTFAGELDEIAADLAKVLR